jgi:hypothetical protein
MPIENNVEDKLPPALDSENPFIFTPLKFQKRTQAEEVPKVLWIQGEVAEVVVRLRNPFAFPIVLDSITLR